MHPSAVYHVAKRKDGTWRETSRDDSLLFTYLLDPENSRKIVHVVVAGNGAKVLFATRTGATSWVESGQVKDEELCAMARADRLNLLDVIEEMRKQRPKRT